MGAKMPQKEPPLRTSHDQDPFRRTDKGVSSPTHRADLQLGNDNLTNDHTKSLLSDIFFMVTPGHSFVKAIDKSGKKLSVGGVVEPAVEAKVRPLAAPAHAGHKPDLHSAPVLLRNFRQVFPP